MVRPLRAADELVSKQLRETMRTYFTLCTRNADGRWSPEFGAYSRETVREERADYRESGWKAKDLKIIETGTRQADITAAVAALNNH